MEIFKYCRSEHMSSLLARGEVRLGTLFDWRRRGAYGELVADETEGYTRLSGNILWYDKRFVGAVRVESSTVDESTEGNRRVHFTNHAIHTPDVFTLSASTTYSEADHRAWMEKEGYDACYRVRSARLFFRAISRVPELAAVAEFVCFGAVHYYDERLPNHVFHGTFHPALLKRAEFGSQAEVRALWAPRHRDGEIAPMVLRVSGTARYCCAHRVLG